MAEWRRPTETAGPPSHRGWTAAYWLAAAALGVALAVAACTRGVG